MEVNPMSQALLENAPVAFKFPYNVPGIDNVTTIKKSIFKSQHCQRNFDLSSEIPQEHMDVIMTAATQCPSKQNVAFYKAHFIQDRDLIENKILPWTNGFVVKHGKTRAESEYTTNAQILANLLIVFEEYMDLSSSVDAQRNEQVIDLVTGKANQRTMNILKNDQLIAVGVAAGYLNLTATMLGYSTGCCSCFEPDGIKEVLGLEGKPLLLMGIGVSDSTKSRRQHQMSDFVFPTKKKQEIPVKIW
jgi:nitroreductase